ncbi:MAG: hypothetical protein K9M57_01400 [Phycisphaerae bacterium]|nr:hypothetical protein [Phycisphaerae bacterium]
MSKFDKKIFQPQVISISHEAVDYIPTFLHATIHQTHPGEQHDFLSRRKKTTYSEIPFSFDAFDRRPLCSPIQFRNDGFIPQPSKVNWPKADPPLSGGK